MRRCDTIRSLEQHALPQGCQAALILETDGTKISRSMSS